MIVYNVHGLVHLAGDVTIYGNLDNFSAFPFENTLKSLKKLVRKPSHVLQQISRRLGRKENRMNIPNTSTSCKYKKEHSIGPITDGFRHMKQYAQVQTNNYFCHFIQVTIVSYN